MQTHELQKNGIYHCHEESSPLFVPPSEPLPTTPVEQDEIYPCLSPQISLPASDTTLFSPRLPLPSRQSL